MLKADSHLPCYTAPSEPRFIPDSNFTCSRIAPLGFRVVKVGAVSHILVATEFCPGRCKGKPPDIRLSSEELRLLPFEKF